MALSTRITQLRKEKGWSQKELAVKLGVGQTIVSGWETNRFAPQIESLIKIAQLFKVSVDYLLFENIPREGTHKIDDFELYEAFRFAESLLPEEKAGVLDHVSALVFRKKVKQAEQEAEKAKKSAKETHAPPLRKVAGKRS